MHVFGSYVVFNFANEPWKVVLLIILLLFLIGSETPINVPLQYEQD